jgi:hypothetical protein
MRRWTIINIVLAVLVILLVWEIYGTWARSLLPVDMSPRAAPPPPAAGPRERGKRSGPDKNAARGPQDPAMQVATVVEKELFDPSRRPAPVEEMRQPETAPVTAPPAGVTFVGSRILGRDREAFVVDASQGNQQRRLRAGDQVGGYTVKAVEPARLLLTSPSGDPVEMTLGLDKSKAPTPRPARGTQPGQAALSPAAGVQSASPAAGVPVRTPAPAPAVPASPPPPVAGAQPATVSPPPGTPSGGGQLPADVRQRLEELRRKEGSSRAGRSRQ